jgi:hypothetical protein
LATWSTPTQSGSTSVRLIVGGTVPVFTVSAVSAPSTPPAAPRQWPCMDFVDETSVRAAFASPSARRSVRTSPLSPTGVEVAWAFT